MRVICAHPTRRRPCARNINEKGIGEFLAGVEREGRGDGGQSGGRGVGRRMRVVIFELSNCKKLRGSGEMKPNNSRALTIYTHTYVPAHVRTKTHSRTHTYTYTPTHTHKFIHPHTRALTVRFCRVVWSPDYVAGVRSPRRVRPGSGLRAVAGSKSEYTHTYIHNINMLYYIFFRSASAISDRDCAPYLSKTAVAERRQTSLFTSGSQTSEFLFVFPFPSDRLRSSPFFRRCR